MTRDMCEHMTTVTLADGRTVTLDKLAECEEALRCVEEAHGRLLVENERLRAAIQRHAERNRQGVVVTVGPHDRDLWRVLDDDVIPDTEPS